MGMREYSVTGYGIDIESLSNMIDDNKLLKAYAEITEQQKKKHKKKLIAVDMTNMKQFIILLKTVIQY